MRKGFLWCFEKFHRAAVLNKCKPELSRDEHKPSCKKFFIFVSASPLPIYPLCKLYYVTPSPDWCFIVTCLILMCARHTLCSSFLCQIILWLPGYPSRPCWVNITPVTGFSRLWILVLVAVKVKSEVIISLLITSVLNVLYNWYYFFYKWNKNLTKIVMQHHLPGYLTMWADIFFVRLMEIINPTDKCVLSYCYRQPLSFQYCTAASKKTPTSFNVFLYCAQVTARTQKKLKYGNWSRESWFSTFYSLTYGCLFKDNKWNIQWLQQKCRG